MSFSVLCVRKPRFSTAATDIYLNCLLNSSYKDPENNVTIDFFQLNITSFQAQIYPNLAKTSLVGYNGISPGPTFKVQRGIQSVIRVVNHNGKCVTAPRVMFRQSDINHRYRSAGCTASPWIILPRGLGWLGRRLDTTGPIQGLLLSKLQHG